MITPIREMTINQIMKRKDDLLVSGNDINEIAANVRNKTIDDFAKEVMNQIVDSRHQHLTVTDCKIILRETAEQLKDKIKR